MQNSDRYDLPFCICSLLFACRRGVSAEIVVFKNGRTMSAKSYTVVGDMATLVLREGGAVTFPSSIIERVEPDEVPYPALAGVATEVPQVDSGRAARF